MVYHWLLNIAPCAIQQNCIFYSFYIYWFAIADPKLPIHPSPPPLGVTSLCSVSVKMLGASLSTHCRNCPSAFVVEQMEAQETNNRFSQDPGDIKHQTTIRQLEWTFISHIPLNLNLEGHKKLSSSVP